MLRYLQNILCAVDDMLLYPSLVREVPASPHKSFHDVLRSSQPTLKSLGQEVAESFTSPLDPHRMSRMSARLQRRYLEKLQSSSECMLPSFNHTLPTGREGGRYLALDVGGSTLRVALVELRGREGLRILQMSVSSINNAARRLPGSEFFSWMAEKIANMLASCPQPNGRNSLPLPVGLSWSFPVEQTSSRCGKVQGMGKGFCCAQATIGQDLGGLIVAACRDQGLNLRIDALVNDSCATLLSRAYSEPSTSMSLILGTGTNMAIHLPVSCLDKSKLQDRDEEWLSQAEKVTINTELSMFGKGILPETRWDELLNRTHLLPNFQPLEYMTTGRYLGEILRLVITEAVETAGLFGGHLPSSIAEPYSLETALLAMIEEDKSSNLSKSSLHLKKVLDLTTTPSTAEMAFIRLAVGSISQRAAAYIAIAIHALWAVERNATTGPAAQPSSTTIVCNGSVVEKYPGFRARCQDFVAEIIECDAETTAELHDVEVVLQIADDEATILGAAVAVAVGKDQV